MTRPRALATFATRARWRVFAFIHALLQLLVPPGKRHVCFASIPDYADNSFAVYRHALRTRQTLHITWLVVDISLSERIQREFHELVADARDVSGHTVRVVPRHSLRGYIAFLRCRVVFHTHGVFAFAQSAHRREIVNLWHGMPIKAIGHLDGRTRKLYYPHGSTQVATSEVFRPIIAAAFGVPVGDVLLTTLPRTDPILSRHHRGASAPEVRRALGVPAGRSLVMWLPTFRTEVAGDFAVGRSDDGHPNRPREEARSFLDDLPAGLLDTIDAVGGRRGCHIVVKLHPLDALNYERLSDTYDSITFFTADAFTGTGLQLYDALAACDALMSDVSSVMIDFEPSGRPIGLIGLPIDTYDRDLLFPLELFTHSPRFAHLVDERAIEDFFTSIADGGRGGVDESLSTLLHQRFERSGAESVLSHAGL